MGAELARPGVEVIQSFRKASPTYVRPTLAPVVIGPAFEVINVLTSDGTINPKAKYGVYGQIGKTITQMQFPDPRGNLDELDVLEASIRPFMLTGGKLSELLMNPGESFLVSSHAASKAVVRVAAASGGVSGLGGKVLIIAIDQPVRLDTSEDIVITFPGSGSLTPDAIIAAINSAVGQTVASKVLDAEGAYSGYIDIASPTFGALSSVTIRSGGSANSVLGIGYVASAAHEERVEGAGYRAQDLQNNTTLSSWVEFYRGDYLVDGATTVPVADKTGWVNLETGAVAFARAAAVTFGDAGTIPLKKGDYFYGDGLRVKDAEVMNVEQARFRLGTVNTSLSTADDNGRYVNKVYDAVSIGTIFDTNTLAPKYVYFRATGLTSAAVPTAAAATGTVQGTAATAAFVESGSLDFDPDPLALAGLSLHVVVTVDGVEHDQVLTFAGGPYATLAAVVADVEIEGVIATESSDKIKLSTAKTGRLQKIEVKPDGTANLMLGFATNGDTEDEGTDVEFTGLTAKELKFSFDKNPHIYSAVFTSDSLDVAIETINAAVGATVASKDATGADNLVLASFLKGAASQVKIIGGDAATVLGFTADQVENGSGRPLPDAYLDGVNNLVIGSEILRDPVTGLPLDHQYNTSQLYVQFKALRRDVSPVAAVPGVIRIPDVETLASVLDPITEENPLALGLFLCQLNCPGFEVKGLGVDEVTGAAPEGTELAYARATELLSAEEVYAVAPLTHNEVVHGTFQTHVTLMSEPENGGERILFQNKKMPVRKNAKVALSGSSANATLTPNQVLLDSSPVAGLVDLGVNAALPLKASDGVYVELTWEGTLYKWNVASVAGALVTLRTIFAVGENADAFYSTVALPSDLLNASYAVKVRGASLVIPGSSPARLDYSLVAETVAEANTSIGNRRVYSVFPDTVKTTVGGIEKALPGYFACAAIAGMVAGQPPQQGFTNFPTTGLTGVVGTEKFTRRQLNVMAGGGTYILTQEVEGGAVFSRHQLSTDTKTVETRELSITKVVDFVAKFLRQGVRRYIGRQNINSIFLDTLGTTIQGLLAFLAENGVINGASLNNLIQDKTNPDTILVDVTLDVPFPCNYIRLTLVV